jgi:RimJ/RimL family protein N-acetyltransferase
VRLAETLEGYRCLGSPAVLQALLGGQLMSPATGSSDPLAPIDTELLHMRPLSEADETFFCDLYADPQTMRFVGPPLSREQAQRSFRIILSYLRRRPLDHLFMLIVEKASHQAIGIGSLQDLDKRRRRVEAGVVLKTGARGQGFGKDALAALVRRGFATFPVDEVWIQHAAANSLAKGVPLSLGLSRNLEATSGEAKADERPAKYVWSAYRASWRCSNQ